MLSPRWYNECCIFEKETGRLVWKTENHDDRGAADSPFAIN